MKRILHATLFAVLVAALAMPLAAADLEAPVCSAASLAGSAQAAPSEAVAGAPAQLPVAGPIGPIEPPTCGNVVCPIGTRCCNPLCSACTPPGVSCTLGDCGHGPAS